ncbi:hypothetical protein D9V37_03870 [Nocardioides mangrovicus]|uniref:Uncharacterized protein n=1 Tax=Nocardioides mangrovicus TaxID=2478913 RepID=A0A3L8P6T7_9ACTN|nr:hypothetical protein [Nocardioides mangrovicus]RLV51066.1 hypothetical protein D9V37_03870 [Nocardioides mangrovicus]
MGLPLDLLTRWGWRAVGRRVDLTGRDAWLTGPTSVGPTVRDAWLDAYAAQLSGTVHEQVPGAGLVPDLAVLDGPGFAAAALHRSVRDFYEHTERWRMEVWAAWSPLFWPGGELISRLFGRRVDQLALPMRPLDVARGMDSRVAVITDAHDVQVAAGWLRTLRSTGEYVYSGCYSHRTLPGAERPSVHVAFPLESGNVQVFLRPENGAGGSLWLHSSGGRFGGDGAYVVVLHGDRPYAATAPLRETFHVFVDDDGVLRTDHTLRIRSATALRLHYKLERRTP